MKKKALFYTFLLVLMTTLSSIRTEACTNIIITRGASVDGSNMISYAADSHLLYGELYYHPAMKWKAGSLLSVYDWDSAKFLGKIPQVSYTYQTVGNMNEHQLIIAETTYGGREELQDPNGIMDYGSLIYIALQRCKTAREAIECIVSLANEYGYYSSGETFSIADKNEAWIMELIGKGSKIVDGKNINKGIVWVARRIPDGYISAHANQSRITTFPLNDPENCLYAKDVISFAREQGYFEGEDKDFSFNKAYAPLSFMGMRACEARAWSAFNILSDGKFSFEENSKMITKDAYDYLDYAMGYNAENPMPLWIKAPRKLSVKDMANAMRDHYEGTPMDMTKDVGAGGNALPYRWRPLSFKEGDKTYLNERAIATQQTGFWFVAQARPSLPDYIGGLLWFGTDDAATSYLTPIYASVNAVPPCFEQGNGDMLTYSDSASFWINNRVANACYKMYNQMQAYVRAEIDKFENAELIEVKDIDKKALSMSSEKEAREYLTDKSISIAQNQFNNWKMLETKLLVKFIDGNVKAENNKGEFIHSPYSKHIPDSLQQPGYTKKWKETVVKDNGKVLEIAE